ncbi:MAG: PQQ-binding-like beta-propeller repeat protein [Acetobacteraceae bacterium]|nr:PQQ-binding-like beta-propeller repeat protein [Acetobacteraceae bacterium]
MRASAAVALALGLVFAGFGWLGPVSQAAVPQPDAGRTYHAAEDRSGRYSVPGLTWANAASITRDASFDGAVDGRVYAQPLYWRPENRAHGLVIVATETNHVYGLDAATGHPLWQRILGPPAPRSALPCGNINPLGITGTPVIDVQAGALYLDAMVDQHGSPHHLVFGIRLSDGAMLPGWPVDVEAALRDKGIRFSAAVQNQRGALALSGGRLYVPYGGHWGDCGDYHGMVAGFQLDPPGALGAWMTRAPKGGVWAPGGIASDGRSLFVATGNTEGAREWGDGEAIIRIPPDLHHSTSPRDYFTPSNWRELDRSDTDLGGTNPLPIDLPGTRPLILAMGKDGEAYLLDRENLGGIGHAIAVERAADDRIITSPAAYPVSGRIFVAFQSRAALCPGGGTGGLAAVAISGTPEPGITTAWCAALNGRGAPVVTTTNGKTEPIVWVAGAMGDERLHAFRGDSGQELLPARADLSIAGAAPFATILAAEDALYVAGDARLYAFRLRASPPPGTH